MKMSGGQIVCRALRDAEVRWIFGIPGTHNIELYDVMLDDPDLKPILVTDERGASFMADGVARATGELAAINIVPGAGLTHALSGIAEAFLDQIPMLVLASARRSDTGAAFQLHDIDQSAIARPVCKEIITPTSHRELYPAIRSASALALQAPMGPVMVEIPANLYLFPSELNEDALSWKEAKDKEEPSATTDITEILETLNASQSVALYVGLGAQGAADLLVELADTLDAIVYTTISAKGLFPEDHPRWAWNTMGRAAPPSLQKLEKQFDCLLAIGCRFGEVATGSYGFSPPDRFIHIDIDSDVFHRNYRASHTWTSDARSAIQTLLDSPKLKKCSTQQIRLTQLVEAQTKIRNEQEATIDPEVKRVDPLSLITSLQKEFGPETVFVTDSGNGMFLGMEMLRLAKPRSFLSPVDNSCMGYSIPAAIGAKMAAPDRPVISLTGDGAFLMTGLELLTAATYKVGVIIIVLNDGKLAQIAQFQQASLNRESCTSLAPIDFKAFATSTQCDYVEIIVNGELVPQLRRAKDLSDQGRPVLINVAIDYSKLTFFSKGVVKTNFLRFPWRDRVRLAGRMLKRKILT